MSKHASLHAISRDNMNAFGTFIWSISISVSSDPHWENTQVLREAITEDDDDDPK